jgi:hypothetical protein
MILALEQLFHGCNLVSEFCFRQFLVHKFHHIGVKVKVRTSIILKVSKLMSDFWGMYKVLDEDWSSPILK